jgi:hypothetical protein
MAQEFWRRTAQIGRVRGLFVDPLIEGIEAAPRLGCLGSAVQGLFARVAAARPEVPATGGSVPDIGACGAGYAKRKSITAAASGKDEPI